MKQFFAEIWLWITLPYVYFVYRRDTKKFQSENGRSDDTRPVENKADDKAADLNGDGDNEPESARPR